MRKEKLIELLESVDDDAVVYGLNPNGATSKLKVFSTGPDSALVIATQLGFEKRTEARKAVMSGQPVGIVTEFLGDSYEWHGQVVAVDVEARTVTFHDPRWLFVPAVGSFLKLATGHHNAPVARSPYWALVDG